MRIGLGIGLVGLWGMLVASPFEIGATMAGTLLVPALGLSVLGVIDAARRGESVRPAATVAALWLLAALGRTLTAARPAEEARGPELTVLTYNLLFEGGDTNDALKLLAEQDADVLLLQEVTPQWADRLKRSQLGRYHLIVPHRGTHGMAVLSRYPLTHPRAFDNDEGRLIGQCVTIGLGDGVGVCHVHLASPSGAVTQSRGLAAMGRALERNARRRARQWRRLEAEMTRSHRPVVIAGDFNTLPAERWLIDARRRWIDVARASSWRPPPTWPRLAWSAHQPPWPIDWVAGSGPWFRIDYIFAAPSVVVRSAATLSDGGSDHLPVLATVVLP